MKCLHNFATRSLSLVIDIQPQKEAEVGRTTEVGSAAGDRFYPVQTGRVGLHHATSAQKLTSYARERQIGSPVLRFVFEKTRRNLERCRSTNQHSVFPSFFFGGSYIQKDRHLLADLVPSLLTWRAHLNFYTKMKNRKTITFFFFKKGFRFGFTFVAFIHAAFHLFLPFRAQLPVGIRRLIYLYGSLHVAQHNQGCNLNKASRRHHHQDAVHLLSIHMLCSTIFIKKLRNKRNDAATFPKKITSVLTSCLFFFPYQIP